MTAQPQQQVIGEGLGASELAAALGLSPFKAPLDVYHQQVGEVEPFTGNDQTAWGQDVEPALRSWYSRTTGRAIWVPKRSRYHPVHTFLRATPDGIVLHRDGEATENPRPQANPAWDHLVECKKAGGRVAHRWGDPGTDQIPIEYLVQTQIQMEVLGLDHCDVVATIAGEPPTVYPIARNDDFIEMLLEGAVTFWGHVQRREPPPIDGSGAWTAYLEESYPFSNETLVEVLPSDEVMPLVEELKRLTLEGDERDDRIAVLKNLLKARIGEHAGMKTPIGKITWRQSKAGSTIDWEAVARDLLATSGRPATDLIEVVLAHTKTKKAARPFCLPRSWRSDVVAGAAEPPGDR